MVLLDSFDLRNEPVNFYLASRSVYLAGPIDHCTDEEIHEWREKAEDLLAPMKCYNPADRVFTAQQAADHNKEVVTLDKVEINASDALLVWYKEPAGGSRMTGTTMEIIHAFERGKLVVIITPYELLSPWVHYHSHRIYSNLEHGVNFIKDTFK